MRWGIVALAFVTAACGQPPPPPAEPSGAGEEPQGAAHFVISPDSLVGVWSFDRTCGSGDGMRLNPDFTATFDEWGVGVWEIGADNSIVLTLARSEPGVDDAGETVVYTLTVTAPVTADLAGRLDAPGEPEREINARRCAE